MATVTRPVMPGLARAGEFPAGRDWLNADRPLKLEELRGKVVLLDFWTFGCINCMHMVPQLRALEERFRDILVVIGVHSAKYTAEQRTANIRQAVLRYDVRHPVVNDADHAIWDSFAVSAWPTAALITPDGRIVGNHAGEFTAGQFAALITDTAAPFEEQGLLNHTPLSWALERDREPARPLHFPSKVLADEASGRLFIADTRHHRVLVADLEGRVQAVVGRGEPGLEDGSFERAAFNAPQGMAVRGDTLFVADTMNHAIRRVDVAGRRVERIAGTGEQLRLARRGGPALEQALTSPWDLALDGERLYIAMAGHHQIWMLDLEHAEVRRIVGTGREALADGSLVQCALAQPSGLALADGHLYFADSESSAIRVAALREDRVETIVGQGLFRFGDRDGQGAGVLLQHPLGVARCNGTLFIADAYNNKIKRVDPLARTSWALAGGGEPGLHDGRADEAQFWEPGGLSLCGDRLYVADTNNHAIRVVDLATGAVRTLEITGV